MSKKIVDEQHSKEALKEMIEDRKPGEPVEEVLATFCQRYSVTMATCKSFYDELVAEGEIKEK
jgi:hypothetical protein